MRTIQTSWFRDKLAEKQLSQRGLARLMGLDSAAVSLMLRGRREMKITEAAMIANLLGVSTEEVIAHVGAKPRRQAAPVQIIGVVGTDARIRWGEFGEVPRPVADLPLNVAAVQCRTAGSELDFMDRWILFIPSNPDNGEVRPECVDRMSVVRATGDESCISQVRRGYAPGRWNLRGPNCNADEVELDYAAPIILITT